MVRLKDIAERVGVSIMTVSKALRDEPDVSSGTKGRIKLVAEQMGYVPDSSAQGLRTRTTKLFGLVISATTNPIFARTVFAIEERAHELGYDVLLAQTLNLPEPEARIYQELRARQTPVVLLGPPSPFCSGFVSVQIEELAASYLVTQHLLELGHRKIAFLTGPSAAPWARERFAGYCRALRETGMEVDDRRVFQAGSTIEDGVNAALQMANEKSDATAIQAVNDLVAIGSASTLLDQRLRIPQDLASAGFGNVLTAEHFRVPLTTVRQPKFRLGTAAVDAMMQLLAGQRPDPKRLPAELIVRHSTAPPPAN